MSKAIISPGHLHGCVQIPPSKSITHRAIICAALAKGKSTLSPILLSDDIKATINAIQKIGAKCILNNNMLTIDGSKTFHTSQAEINCYESGSTLRFLIPVCAAGGITCTFNGCGRLPYRPVGIYTNILPKANVSCYSSSGLPLTISGKLCSGTFHLPGNISSQFITGLMLALPLLSSDSTIILTSPLESEGYISLTINILNQFGISVQKISNGWYIKGNQTYKPQSYIIESDWSQAAFFMSASTLGNTLELKGLNPNSVQGDKEGLNIFKQFGMQTKWEKNNLLCSPCSPKAGESNPIIDAAQIPDLVPAIAVTAALSSELTVITNAKRLRLKESDRLASVADGLQRLGISVLEQPDGLIIKGNKSFQGGEILGYNDHRIVMSFTIGALRAKSPVTITDANSIKKSYPNFFEDFINLGGIYHGI